MCNPKQNARIEIIWEFLCGYCPQFENCPIDRMCAEADRMNHELMKYENLPGNDTED